MHRPFLSLFLLRPLSLLPSRSWLHPEKLLPPSHTAAKGHLSCLFPRYRERVSSLSMAIFILFFVLAALGELAAAEPVQDRAALQAFLAQTPHERRVNWSASTSACDWAGVVCNGGRTAVVELHLPAVGLVGPVPPGTLGRLSSLRVLSLRSNALSGPIPDDLGNLTGLNSMFLQDNKLSGELPPSLTRLAQLNRLDLSGNNLTGEIPLGMNNLTHLKKLFLERNSFSGSLPSIDIGSLVKFNVSYNQLSGQIPRSLEKFQASSFVGNLDLCGGPLPPCSSPPAPSPAGVPQNPGEKSSKKLSTAAIVAISVAGGMVLLLAVLLLAICLVFRRRRRRRATTTPPPKRDTEAVGAAPGAGEGPSTSKGEVGSAGEAERSRLVFVGRGGGYSFDLEELLRASAEVLGKGTLGTSYKAVLEDGTTVVVKRLRDVAVGRREFEAHMETLGNMADHPNVLPLRAYYYSKDEKLLVFDYLPGGSLSSLLHGSRGSGRTPLDWESRMRVALAAGRGLVHLHASAALPHGNLKASNVILRHDPASAAVSDYALGPLFAPAAAPPLRVPGYRAPEVVETRRPSFKADVYSFGVLLLELLTGRAPNQAGMGGGDDGVDLPRWVQSVVREEWTAEVFDTDLMRYPGAEEEMVGLLQVGMACVATVPDVRPDMAEVVKMMEDIINRRETDDGLLQSSDEPTPHAAATP